MDIGEKYYTSPKVWAVPSKQQMIVRGFGRAGRVGTSVMSGQEVRKHDVVLITSYSL